VAGAFALLVGGAPAHPAEPPPVIVAVVLDTSGSLGASDLEAARALASGLLRALPPGSEAAVFAFADDSRLLLERTSDVAAVDRRSLLTAPAAPPLRRALRRERYLRDAGHRRARCC
jgi:Mg-chelatase subunit ChlD